MDDQIDTAFSEFEDLANEMEEWYENMPENFQQGDKGSEVEEAKDALQNLSKPDVPEALANLLVTYIPAEDISSRADRCSDASARLSMVVEVLQERLDELQEQAKKESKTFFDADGLEDFISELETAAQDADGISFPGMY